MFLSEDEVRGLIIRAQEGDQDAYQKLLAQIDPFIKQLASKANMKKPWGMPREDLEQIGRLAVAKAIPPFRLDRGVKFITYVGVAATRAIRRAASRWHALPQIADEEGAEKWLVNLRDQHETDGTATPEDERTAQALRLMSDVIRDCLNPRERVLITYRYGLDGRPPVTLEELALLTGTTRQNIHQIIERSLGRIKEIMLYEGPGT